MNDIHDVESDRLAHAREQGQAQFDHIVELVEDLTHCDMQTNDEAERAIHGSALEVLVRSDWHAPGPLEPGQGAPVEYRIVLCTGGPAVQIVGKLSEHGEPETAHLEVQDWFTPWMEYRPVYKNSHDPSSPSWLKDANAGEGILLTYARCFWFGG